MSTSSTTLHVGNLSFQLNEKDLENFFSKYGKVTDTYIVRRGGRPRGYGFVEFSSTKEADNALAANGEEIEGRQINIELANGKIVKSNNQNPPRRNNYGNNNYGNNNNYGGNNNYRNNNYGNNNYGNNNYGNNNNYGGNYNGNYVARNNGPRSYNRNGRNFYTLKPLNYGRNSYNGPRRYNNNNNNGPRRFNNNNRNRTPVEKEKTLTTIYVSNLPFSFDEKELADVFSKYKVKTAHVVQARNGRSRGYGFVEFETEEDQLNAIKVMDQFNVKGADGKERTINVKIALIDKASGNLGGEDNGTNENRSNSPTGSPKTTAKIPSNELW